MLSNNIIVPIKKDLSWWQGFLHANYYGAVYEREHWRYVAKSIIKRTGIPKGSKVLELGSGSGELLINMSQLGMISTGVELSPYLVDHSNNSALERGCNLNIIHENMFKFIPKEKYDLILSVNTSFGYGSDEEIFGLIKSIGSWLPVGGKFFFDTITSDNAKAFGRWTDNVAKGKLTVYNGYDKVLKLMRSSIKWVSETGETYISEEPEIVKLYSRDVLVNNLLQSKLNPIRLQSAMNRAFRQSVNSEFTTWLAEKK